MKWPKKQSGFTLAELMVSVAVVGTLTTVAIPNYKDYQAKSKTAEAKIALANIYTAQESWYADFETYANCLDVMGLSVQASGYYAVGYFDDTTSGTVLNEIHGDAIINGAPPSCSINPASVNNQKSALKIVGAGDATCGGPACLSGGTPATVSQIQSATLNMLPPGFPDVNLVNDGYKTTATTHRAVAAGYISDLTAAGPGFPVQDIWIIDENKRFGHVVQGW